MVEYNRKDNDGHKFNIPNDLLEKFDNLFTLLCKAKRGTENYFEIETAFCNKFYRYMVG